MKILVKRKNIITKTVISIKDKIAIDPLRTKIERKLIL
jgi:hypothetical protein